MPTVTLEQVNKNVLELRKQLIELENQTHQLRRALNKEEKGWDALAEESLKEVWDNEKDAKVWQKYL